MTIFTKEGDEGETSISKGKRLRKSDTLIEVYGTLDELNVALGTALAFAKTDKSKTLLPEIQKQVFEISTHISEKGAKVKELDIRRIENQIKIMEERLQVMQHFIIPGGTKGSCFIHQARIEAREVERRLVSINANKTYLAYFNRLSDLLFVLARWENKEEGVDEEIWKEWES
ncbi:cob(I)yrinic acid a,c-diamide adenosyltransferase [Candidatus Micrarchaeota archaeon]|nr:cob(I)yrinic acid a,c-diamide adenosyltransferase [Candidatus Micrarchaeota archaeon]MBD3417576.1 cob(I)yrinic acid a,c-diamide adenosyltransferase [Candidatus Micrarchaeota archaeon]